MAIGDHIPAPLPSEFYVSSYPTSTISSVSGYPTVATTIDPSMSLHGELASLRRNVEELTASLEAIKDALLIILERDRLREQRENMQVGA